MSRYAPAYHHVSVVAFQSESSRKKQKGKNKEENITELAERT